MSKDFQTNWMGIFLQRIEEVAGQEIKEKVQEEYIDDSPPTTKSMQFQSTIFGTFSILSTSYPGVRVHVASSSGLVLTEFSSPGPHGFNRERSLHCSGHNSHPVCRKSIFAWLTRTITGAKEPPLNHRGMVFILGYSNIV